MSSTTGQIGIYCTEPVGRTHILSACMRALNMFAGITNTAAAMHIFTGKAKLLSFPVTNDMCKHSTFGTFPLLQWGRCRACHYLPMWAGWRSKQGRVASVVPAHGHPTLRGFNKCWGTLLEHEQLGAVTAAAGDSRARVNDRSQRHQRRCVDDYLPTW